MFRAKRSAWLRSGAALVCAAPFVAGCEEECEGAACGSLYTRAEVGVFSAETLTASEVDPRLPDAVVEGGETDGFDWALHGGTDGILVGVPAADQARWYRLADGAASLEATLAPPGTGERFGASLATTGDTLLVGAPARAAGPLTAGAGAVYVYASAGATLSGDPSVTSLVLGDTTDDRFGEGVWGCGDLDTDGAADWIASAPWSSAGGDLAGSVYVALSSAPVAQGESNASDLPVRLDGAGDGAGFGASATCATSLDGDHLAELVVGAPYAEVDRLGSVGAVSFWQGGSAVGGDPTLTLAGAEPGDAFGAALATGDLDGDGAPELVVGAPGVDTVATEDDVGGAVYVYASTALAGHLNLPDFQTEALKPARTLRGESAPGRFGTSLAIADLDGDGVNDLVIGAPGTNRTDKRSTIRSGAATVWYGPFTDWPELQLASEAPVTLVADRQYLETGRALATAEVGGQDVLVVLTRAAE